MLKRDRLTQSEYDAAIDTAAGVLQGRHGVRGRLHEAVKKAIKNARPTQSAGPPRPKTDPKKDKKAGPPPRRATAASPIGAMTSPRSDGRRDAARRNAAARGAAGAWYSGCVRRFALLLTLGVALGAAVPLASAEPPTTHEILSTRPSGFWTSNRPATNGAYRWRLLGIGVVLGDRDRDGMLRLVKARERRARGSPLVPAARDRRHHPDQSSATAPTRWCAALAPMLNRRADRADRPGDRRRLGSVVTVVEDTYDPRNARRRSAPTEAIGLRELHVIRARGAVLGVGRRDDRGAQVDRAASLAVGRGGGGRASRAGIPGVRERCRARPHTNSTMSTSRRRSRWRLATSTMG